VARGVKNLHVDVPEIKYFSVPYALKPIPSVGALVQHVCGTRNFGESSPAAYVIRVQMRIDHVPDIQAVFLGHSDVEIRLINGVAHGALSSATSTKNVRSSNGGLLVEQLT
jgi:hypothetical protein